MRTKTIQKAYISDWQANRMKMKMIRQLRLQLNNWLLFLISYDIQYSTIGYKNDRLSPLLALIKDMIYLFFTVIDYTLLNDINFNQNNVMKKIIFLMIYWTTDDLHWIHIHHKSRINFKLAFCENSFTVFFTLCSPFNVFFIMTHKWEFKHLNDFLFESSWPKQKIEQSTKYLLIS